MRKFLICGLGSIGQRHVRLLKKVLGEEADIHAYRSRGLDIVIQDNMQASPGVKPELHYGITAHTSLDAALQIKPEAVFVTNPISMHVGLAQNAAEQGCHLFIEKPLGDSLAGVEELEKTVHRKNLVATVGYQLRFHPALQKIKSLLAEKAIGRIISASIHFGEWLPGMHPYEDYRISHAARKDQGGGVILCLSHEIDYACWLFGWPLRVTAAGGKYSDLEMDVEDTADLFLECPGEAGVVPVMVHVDFLQRPPRRNCLIVGESGTIEWDYFQNRLVLTKPGEGGRKEITFEGFVRNDMFVAELTDFLDSIERRRQPRAPLSEGAGTLAVCLAAKQSMEQQKTVSLNWKN